MAMDAHRERKAGIPLLRQPPVAAPPQRATPSERLQNAVLGAVFIGVLVAIVVIEGRPGASFFGSAIEGACLAGGAYLLYAAAHGRHVRWW